MLRYYATSLGILQLSGQVDLHPFDLPLMTREAWFTPSGLPGTSQDNIQAIELKLPVMIIFMEYNHVYRVEHVSQWQYTTIGTHGIDHCSVSLVSKAEETAGQTLRLFYTHKKNKFSMKVQFADRNTLDTYMILLGEGYYHEGNEENSRSCVMGHEVIGLSQIKRVMLLYNHTIDIFYF